MGTRTITLATRSYLLLTSLLIISNPDTAESKSPVSEDEAAALSSILFDIKSREGSNVLSFIL